MVKRKSAKYNSNSVVYISSVNLGKLPKNCGAIMEYFVVTALAETQKRYKTSINCFNFIPRNFYLILSGPKIDKFLRRFKSRLKNHLYNFSPELKKTGWEPSFVEEELNSTEEVIQKTSEIFLAPVKAGLVKKAKNWRWYKEYMAAAVC